MKEKTYLLDRKVGGSSKPKIFEVYVKGNDTKGINKLDIALKREFGNTHSIIEGRDRLA